MPFTSKRKTQPPQPPVESDYDNSEEFYGGQSTEPPTPKPPARFRPKHFLWLAAFVVFVVFISSFTSFFISRFSNSMDFLDTFTDVVGDFKQEMNRERQRLYAKGDEFGQKLERFEGLFGRFETKFANKSFVREGLHLAEERLQSTRESLSQGIKAIAEKTERTDRLITAETIKISALQKDLAALGQKISTTSPATELSQKIKEVQSQLGAIEKWRSKMHLSLKRELESMKERMESKFDLRAFYEARDGSEVDWASRKVGGHVISTGNRKKVLGFSNLWTKRTSHLISPVSGPGDCVGFQTGKGYAVLGLREPIVLTGFSYESVLPSVNPNAGTSPREMRVYAVASDERLVDLSPTGEPFVFDESRSVMKFRFAAFAEPTARVKFEFVSNYGNEDYTCVYRLRVHGRRPV